VAVVDRSAVVGYRVVAVVSGEVGYRLVVAVVVVVYQSPVVGYRVVLVVYLSVFVGYRSVVVGYGFVLLSAPVVELDVLSSSRSSAKKNSLSMLGLVIRGLHS
jgi:hypothetical protein